MTIYLTEKQIEKINALAIQRYSPNEKIQTVSSSALNMIVNLPENLSLGSLFIQQFLIKQRYYLSN
ncbi:prophage maintenance system killer protein [Streptococcus pneumoniae]|nr:prophage maintenance system killer protein [Streptococcus pneumoniae]CGF55195.1 prophage maintenance system killer protein [Streptococcus pneumoniae]CJK39462.1 prophage maintenance system killer protein [Streptococcus pneumoniae]CJS56540.1 prophage maintenance system killer protein [Streptococcus pneumoniae]COA16349.1 prophage maintenance system killer protein [Streptococcus pneumoniae]